MNKKIFIQIASYRDSDCLNTIDELYLKAKYPENIFIGLNWQYSSEDSFEPFKNNKFYSKNIRILKYDVRHSRGVCWAREKIQNLFDGEEYTMQIDSHMRFIPHWDEELLNMYTRITNSGVKKVVISHYPPHFTLDGEYDTWQGKMSPNIRHDNIVFFKLSGFKIEQDDSFPLLSASIAGGFWFAKSSCIDEIPYDPYIYFHGEEITLSVRFWTYGWNIYNPSKIIVYHLFKKRMDKESGKKIKTREIKVHRDDHDDYMLLEKKSIQRIKYLLGTKIIYDNKIIDNISPLYFGNERSIYQYEVFSGINFKNVGRNHFSRLGIYFDEGIPLSYKDEEKYLKEFHNCYTQLEYKNIISYYNTLEVLKINSILDISLNKARELNEDIKHNIQYIGIDIDSHIINKNRFIFRTEKNKLFIQQNILKSSLPKTTAILCYDFFELVPTKMGWGLLRNISKSGIRYIFANKSIANNSLTSPPYYLPEAKMYFPIDNNKLIGVWDILELEIYTYAMNNRFSLLRSIIIDSMSSNLKILNSLFINDDTLLIKFLKLMVDKINSTDARNFYKNEIKNDIKNYDEIFQEIFCLRYASKWDFIRSKYPQVLDSDKQFVIALVNEYISLFLKNKE